MAKTNHLTMARTNYKLCVSALAKSERDRAIEWLDAAIEHLDMYMEDCPYEKLTAVRETKSEYEKLRSTILSTSGNNSGIYGVVLAQKVKAEEQPVPKNNLTFDDVVGLDDVKEAVRRAVVYPFKYADIYKAFKRSSGGGILLYGAPGTGKTMLAKAISGEIDAKFFSVNCSDILSKWMGESQQNIKKIFEEARTEKCAVIFFDEFEALGCVRHNDSEGSNAITGVVCELLAQIDGFSSTQNSTILVIAATNRPWDVDSALLRSGRFGRHFYIPMPDSVARSLIIQKQMAELPTHGLNFEALSEQTDGFSSADITELCNLVKDRAIMRSIERKAISEIMQTDFKEVLKRKLSTVNATELQRLKDFA